VSAQSGDRELHARCGAELRFCDAIVDETDGAVKWLFEVNRDAAAAR